MVQIFMGRNFRVGFNFASLYAKIAFREDLILQKWLIKIFRDDLISRKWLLRKFCGHLISRKISFRGTNGRSYVSNMRRS